MYSAFEYHKKSTYLRTPQALAVGVSANNKTWIIEVMGKQHSKKSFETCGGRSLSDEIENDKLKHEYAIQQNIDYYVTIDAHNTCYINMRDSILNSDLSNIYNLNNIDWNMAYRYALSSRVVECSNLWNQGYRISEISKILIIDRHTVNRYLVKANSISMCKYDSNQNGKVKVICLNTGEVFNNTREAEIKYNIHRGYISGYLKGRNKESGKLNGEKLIWEYYERGLAS